MYQFKKHLSGSCSNLKYLKSIVRLTLGFTLQTMGTYQAWNLVFHVYIMCLTIVPNDDYCAMLLERLCKVVHWMHSFLFLTRC